MCQGCLYQPSKIIESLTGHSSCCLQHVILEQLKSIKVTLEINHCYQACRLKPLIQTNITIQHAKGIHWPLQSELRFIFSCTCCVTESDEHTQSVLTRTKTAGGMEPVSAHRHLFIARGILSNLTLITHKL